jgi:hypothetical protein
MKNVVDNVGPCTRVTGEGSLRYDLPSGGALLILPERPASNISKVRGIQFYRTEMDAPPFG